MNFELPREDVGSSDNKISKLRAIVGYEGNFSEAARESAIQEIVEMIESGECHDSKLREIISFEDITLGAIGKIRDSAINQIISKIKNGEYDEMLERIVRFEDEGLIAVGEIREAAEERIANQ